MLSGEEISVLKDLTSARVPIRFEACLVSHVPIADSLGGIGAKSAIQSSLTPFTWAVRKNGMGGPERIQALIGYQPRLSPLTPSLTSHAVGSNPLKRRSVIDFQGAIVMNLKGCKFYSAYRSEKLPISAGLPGK